MVEWKTGMEYWNGILEWPLSTLFSIYNARHGCENGIELRGRGEDCREDLISDAIFCITLNCSTVFAGKVLISRSNLIQHTLIHDQPSSDHMDNQPITKI